MSYEIVGSGWAHFFGRGEMVTYHQSHIIFTLDSHQRIPLTILNRYRTRVSTGFSLLLYCQDSLVDGIELFDHVRKVQSCGIVHTHYRDSLSSTSSSLLQSEQGEQLLPHAPQSLQVCLAKQDQHLAACTDIDWKHWYTVAGIHLYNPPSPGHTSRKKANITTIIMQSLYTLVIISEPTICCIGKTNKTIHNSHMHVTV